MEAIYDTHSALAAYKLWYGWVAWVRHDIPKETIDHIEKNRDVWEEDGMRILESRVQSNRVMVTFSVLPMAAPVQVAQRTGYESGRLVGQRH